MKKKPNIEWQKPQITSQETIRPDISEIKAIKKVVEYLNQTFNRCPVQRKQQKSFTGFYVNKQNKGIWIIGSTSFYTLESDKFKKIRQIILLQNKFISDIKSSHSIDCIVHKQFKVI